MTELERERAHILKLFKIDTDRLRSQIRVLDEAIVILDARLKKLEAPATDPPASHDSPQDGANPRGYGTYEDTEHD